MPTGVLSVDLPKVRVGVLAIECCKRGIQYEGVVAQDDDSPAVVTVDLLGDAYRALDLALRVGGTPVHWEAEIPHGERVRVYPDRLEGK